jgi:hypothetical protein
MIRQRSPAWITEELLHDYISTAFVPYVLVVRDTAGLENKRAVLPMDSSLADRREPFRPLPGEYILLQSLSGRMLQIYSIDWTSCPSECLKK